MPKLKTKFGRIPLGDQGQSLALLIHKGFVDAANYQAFENAFQEVVASGEKDLVVDFNGVEYINSSGIGTVLKFHEVFKEKGGEMVLISVPKGVGKTMHALGVTSIVPFLATQAAAVKYFRDPARREDAATYYEYLLKKSKPDDGSAAGSRAVKYKVPLKDEAAPVNGRMQVLMVVPQADLFSEILKMRLANDPARFHVVTDTNEALRIFDRVAPDLVVLDDRLSGAEDFLSTIKIQRGKSLVSVIKIYGRTEDLDRLRGFKIWENDYLVEPFELMHLFTLSEAELRRVPKDKQVFLQQVHFQFRTTDRNVERANQLAKSLIDQVGMNDDDAVAIFAAFKEGVDNAVMHGNRNDAARTIDVNFVVGKSRVVIVVEDDGEGFDYHPHLMTAAKDAFEKARKGILEQGQRGGLGILLMRKCMDKVEYVGRGNTLRLEKRFRAG